MGSWELADLVNAGSDANHNGVVEDLRVFAERLLRLQFRLVVNVHPVAVRRDLKQLRR